MHCSLFLQAYWSNADLPSGPVHIFEHGALGQIHQKDACSKCTYSSRTPRKELPFRAEDLPNGDVWKGILNKGAASSFTPPPLFVPTGNGTQRLASLTKMPPALFGIQDTLLCRALLKTASCIKARTAMLWLNGLGGDKLTEPYQHFECALF